MKGIKKILALGLVATMAMGSFVGCSKTQNTKKVGIVLSTLNKVSLQVGHLIFMIQ